VREQLRRHVEINSVDDRVTIVDVALANRNDDEGTLFVSCWPENDGISSLTPSAETIARGGLRSDATIAVRVRRFDTWAAAEKLTDIDLMKIDVEGAEAQVLEGMARTLERGSPRRIICETMPSSDAVEMLHARRYCSSIVDEIPGGIPNLLFESAGAP
jgi:FkbM family methyltransferase